MHVIHGGHVSGFPGPEKPLTPQDDDVYVMNIQAALRACAYQARGIPPVRSATAFSID